MHYFGGKYRERKRIVDRMPPHKTYVEPFAGAGNVLQAKPPAQKEVLSDKDPKVMKVHRGLKARAETWDMRPSRAKWDRIHAKPPSSRTAEEQAYLIGHAYGGFVEDKRQNFHPSGKDGKFDTTKLHSREKDAIMLNKDFAETMRMFDSPTTLHYMDPPYSKTENTKYTERDVTPERVARVAGSMDGKVMVSYDDTAQVRRAFKGPKWRVHSYRVDRSIDKGNRTPGRSVLITNFDPSKERAGAPPYREKLSPGRDN